MPRFIQCCLVIIVTACESAVCAAQPANFTGTVISSSGPVEGASITLKGTPYGTVTSAKGHFIIAKPPVGTYTLQVRCLGYYDTEQTIKLPGNDNENIFYLKANPSILNAVIVTGVSKATPVKENPMPVTSLAARAIQQTVESNIIDVLVRHTPGLNAVKTGPNISKPFIRGLGYNRVLTLYDGMRQEGQQWGDEHGIEVDEYNIQKAEVIKGPASLMYGSDALAGVVSLFPAAPAETDAILHGKITTEYQTNNNLTGSGVYLGHNNGRWLYGVRAGYRIAKNYRNAIDGRVYNTGFNEKNASAFAGYKSNKGSTVLNITVYDDLQGIPDGSRDSLTRKFTRQVFEAGGDDIKNRPVVSNTALNAYTLPPLHQHIQHYRIYSNSNYNIGKGSMQLLLGVQQNIRREYNHPAQPLQPGLYVQLNTANYGVRYNAPAFKNIELSAGINGMLQHNASKNATDFPIPDYNLADGGGYIFGKWKHNGLTVSGGLRYDIRTVRWNDFYVADDNSGLKRHVTGADTTGAALQFAAFKKTFNGLSASMGLTYPLSRQVSIKANIGRGYRSPNITEIASNGLDPGAHIIYLGNREFKPEFSIQEDAGVIVNTGDLEGSISVFNNNLTNYIYLALQLDATGNPVTDAQGNKTYRYQQSAAQLYGLEATLAWHPAAWQGFDLNNSVAVIYGFNRAAAFKHTGINGEYLPLIPPFKMQNSISQKIIFEKGILNYIQPTVDCEFNGPQNRYLGLNNTETFTPAYTLLNAGIITEMQYSRSKAATLQVQVNNVFNTVYQSALSRLKYFEYYTSASNGRPGIYGMGINASVRLTVPF